MLLLRHASAGDRALWQGDDLERPLDKKGRRQAQALVERLAHARIERILSSPARRCVETVEPLARARGLEIEQRPELWEDRQATDGMELVRSLSDEDVLVCGHGGLEHVLPDPPRWKKGGVLELRRGPGGVELV
jgi:phosphohistidine phosphatase SixA